MGMSRTQGIIIEGITGAGKTHTMKALLSNSFFTEHWKPFDVFREKETFGEFMGELMENPGLPTLQKFRLLQSVISTVFMRVGKTDPYHYLLERAHYSYYALLPDWSLYERFDEALVSLNAHVYLLWIPPNQLTERSLYRSERRGWAEGFIEHYGSESSALESFASVQQLRYDGIKKSGVPHTVIDTSEKDWRSYAKTISDSTLQ